MLRISKLLKGNTPKNGIYSLAQEFLKQNPLGNPEGQCAEMARRFEQFLSEQGIHCKIIDARDYKGSLSSVGQSNHVLAAVDGLYVDFTAGQFSPESAPVVIEPVSSLSQNWGVVNTYNSYQDFLSNFSKTQR